jgi:osmotically-inducible protein OsmY
LAFVILSLSSCVKAKVDEEYSEPKLTDEELAHSVSNAISSDVIGVNVVNVWMNGVTVKEGVVTLSGRVLEDDVKSYIGNLARGYPGVKGVINNIFVDEEAYATQKLGEELKKQKSGYQ